MAEGGAGLQAGPSKMVSSFSAAWAWPCPHCSVPLPGLLRGPGAWRRVYVWWGWEEVVTDQHGPQVSNCCLAGIPTTLHGERAISASIRPTPSLCSEGSHHLPLGLPSALTALHFSYLHVCVMGVEAGNNTITGFERIT